MNEIQADTLSLEICWKSSGAENGTDSKEGGGKIRFITQNKCTGNYFLTFKFLFIHRCIYALMNSIEVSKLLS